MMDFDVTSVKTLDEALKALSEYGDDAKVIAGGQSLLNILKQGLMAPEILVDIKGVAELDGLQIGASIRIGANTSHRTLEDASALDETWPVLREMEHDLASVQIRNWGTMGGNLCIADPTGDPAPVLMAYDAEAEIAGPEGKRRLPLEAFFVDYYETVLEPEELLTAVEAPAPPPRSGVAHEKFRNVEGDAPIVVAGVRLTLTEDHRRVEDVRIALGGVAPVPIRALEAEKVLRGQEPSDEALAEAAATAPGETAPIPDITASEAYKKKLVRVLVHRAAGRALERAKGT